jgi:hypothetical protein
LYARHATGIYALWCFAVIQYGLQRKQDLRLVRIVWALIAGFSVERIQVRGQRFKTNVDYMHSMVETLTSRRHSYSSLWTWSHRTPAEDGMAALKEVYSKLFFSRSRNRAGKMDSRLTHAPCMVVISKMVASRVTEA